MMGAAMQEAMGGSVYVENKGGAGGNIGMGTVARSEPDGYTILLSTSAFAVNASLYQTLPYDPLNDFIPVCELAVSPHVFAVKPELGAGTMKEFVALLEQVALDILRRPDMRAKLTESGFEVTAASGKQHAARIAKEIPIFADIIVQAGIKKL